MGTNFYAIIPVQKRLSDKLREIADKIDNDITFLKDELDEELYLFKEMAENNVVHLGKRSGGWVFNWDGNDMRYYEPTLKSIKEFVNKNEAIIIDEYGNKYSWDDFINVELEDVLYDCPELFNGKRYYEKFPNDRVGYVHNYDAAVYKYKSYAKDEYIDPAYHDFITKEGLRFALFTDFS